MQPFLDEQALLLQARQLAGRTLAELAQQYGMQVPQTLHHNKGWIGNLIQLCFGLSANSRAEPDFAALGVELKTLPIRAGKPCESTFVCVVPLLELSYLTWETSSVRHKLSRVLWMPVEAESSIPLAQRRVGMPLLWSPSVLQEQVLKNDWQELTDLVCLGQLDKITARHGTYLQIRPKAANAKALCAAVGDEGERIMTLPRGFYLRTQFTQEILASHYITLAHG